MRVVNVVKRVDGVQGSRYLLELELRDAHGQLLRLSHYIYALNRHSRRRGKDMAFRPVKPQLVLCNPVGFRWYPAATVHFIVPGSPTSPTPITACWCYLGFRRSCFQLELTGSGDLCVFFFHREKVEVEFISVFVETTLTD